VTAVTDPNRNLRETSIVNMVREQQEGLLWAGRHEAAVERGSRGWLRLYRDRQ